MKANPLEFVEFEMDAARISSHPNLLLSDIINFTIRFSISRYYQVHRLFNVERLLKIVHYCCDYTIDKRKTIRNYLSKNSNITETRKHHRQHTISNFSKLRV